MISKLACILLLCGSAAAQTLDIYGGMTALPSTGGATGYFYKELATSGPASGHWMLVDPLGNYYYMFSSYVLDPKFLQISPTNIMQVKYLGNKTNWCSHNADRLKSWKFNTIGEYATTYCLPINTNGSHSNANPTKMPFIYLSNAIVSMTVHPTLFGIPEAPKNMILGVPSGITVYRGGRMTDMYDPKVKTAYQNSVQRDATITYTDGFNTPWILGMTTDDTDYLFGQKNRGDSPVSPHPNIGFIAAVDRFDYSTLGSFIDPRLYTKYAWTCGLAGVDFGYGVGKGYLDSKYVTIAALNTAWSTSSFYTSFCDAGGYGIGTGVLDEDGRHTSWMGADSGNNYVAYKLTGTNSNVAADMNQFVHDYTYKYARTAVDAIRTYDTHHMIFSPPISAAGYETRTQVLQAYKDAGMSVIQMSAPAQGNDLSGIKATYDLLGLPIFLWYGISANADSALNGYTSNQGVPDYGTQANRATHYNSDLNSFLTAQGTDSKYYLFGIDWWEHTDGNFAEKTNWGLVTDRDNPYDAHFDTTTAYPDGSYTSIPEAGNWGDFVTGATATNTGILNTLIGGLSVPTITSGGCGNGTVNVAYTCNMTATGGTLPYTWSFSAGGLTACTGLSLNASTGVISGTPTVAATCSFTEMVTDSSSPTPKIATQDNSITINVASGLPVKITGKVKISGSVVIK